MEISFQTLGTNTYLNMKLDSEETIDSMGLGMLTNNKIPGLAETTFTQMDETRFIRYNVSSKVSAAQIFTGTVNKKRLIGVFSGIVNAMISAEEYMLDTNSFMLDMDYIFVDVSTCETVMICVPVMGVTQNNPDLASFFKEIIFHTQFDQTENCDHVAKIINYLNSNTTLCLTDFKELLDSVSVSQSVPAPVQQPAPKPAAPAPVQPAVQQAPVQQPAQPQVPKAVQQPAAPEKTAEPAEEPSGKEVPGEKPMSMLYLLQHYNKENAEKYKRQKNARKAGTAAPKEKKQSKNSKKDKAASVGFKVPGAPGSGFAVPGQPAPGAAAPQHPAVPQQSTAPQQPAAPQHPIHQPVAEQKPAAPNAISFGETTVLGGAIGETTVLGATELNVQLQPHLIRLKNNERIALDKPVFRIGKENSYVDYFISDNTAISRSHANIINRDGVFYIVDTNSTNHTYINGRMINSNEEVRLNDGETIRLANEEFRFELS